MEVKQVEGSTLQYLAIEPDNYDPNRNYPMVILLHGYGASMSDLAGLCPVIDRDGYVYICPNAPIPIELGMGMQGFAWTPPGGGGTPDHAAEAEDLLSGLFEEVRQQYNVQSGQTLLGGFSQGGMMTYRSGLIDPKAFTGLIALSSRISDTEGLTPRLPEDRSQPIFIAHGTQDSMISVDDARATKEYLEDNGYSPVYNEYAMGHEISQDVLIALVPWIHQTLPPATS